MSRTFLIPGVYEHLADIREYLTDDVCGILLYLTTPESEARRAAPCDEKFRQRLFTYASLTKVEQAPLEGDDWAAYDRCLKAVLADARVFYLAMRSYFDTALNSTLVIEKVVYNTVRILRATRPDRLVASSTPHSVEAWIFARCVEELGLPVFILERTPINNRAWFYRGLDAQTVVERADAPPAALTPYTQSQVREQVESVAGARDARGYYVSRMDLSSIKGAESNTWWSWRRELPLLFGGSLKGLPIRLASIGLKRRLVRSYEKVAVSTLPDGPFVIFFMHYQPERSSLPEGLFYTQQWLALRLIAGLLPPGWKLLVREHPSMWLLPLDITVRPADYYEQIAALPNTQVSSMDLDTFELIDRSAVVSTLTGSVGFQALLRQKPAIVFGLPAYKDHPACITVRDSGELARAFDAVRDPAFAARFSPESLERYLRWVEQHSIVADEKETEWLAVRLKNFRELYRQLFAGQVTL
ncbi:MAG TPA: hypothetical protein VMF52_04330 [Steroidobacteraceae bacterium]|nr:hypothetical protein [Steroidobacteraceae bacterium]